MRRQCVLAVARGLPACPPTCLHCAQVATLYMLQLTNTPEHVTVLGGVQQVAALMVALVHVSRQAMRGWGSAGLVIMPPAHLSFQSPSLALDRLSP